LQLPSDADDVPLAALLSDVDTMAHLQFMRHMPAGWTVQEAAQRRQQHLEQVAQGSRAQFSIYLSPINNNDLACDTAEFAKKQTPEFIGCCGLANIDHAARTGEGGIILSARFHRSGLGAQALFALMNLAFAPRSREAVLSAAATASNGDDASAQPSSCTESGSGGLGLHLVAFETSVDNDAMRHWLSSTCELPLVLTRVDPQSWRDEQGATVSQDMQWCRYELTVDHWHKTVRAKLLAKLCKRAPDWAQSMEATSIGGP
jgi:RimJ/RimL family protein N-acetyltransferase